MGGCTCIWYLLAGCRKTLVKTVSAIFHFFSTDIHSSTVLGIPFLALWALPRPLFSLQAQKHSSPLARVAFLTL